MDLMRTSFFISPSARDMGIHLGDWYGLLSLTARPHTPEEEVFLAGMMQRSLPELTDF